MDEGRVVVGVDGSPCSARALRWAADEARTHGAGLHVLTSYTVPAPPVDPGYGAPRWVGEQAWLHRDQLRDLALETQARVVRETLGEDPGLRLTSEVVEGSAAARLIDASVGARQVVVGSRGHGGFAGMILGSVSQHVLPHAACPVVVVR